jgi:hypothetical protein
MMSIFNNYPAAIILTSQEWFNKCLVSNCTALYFPPNKNPLTIKKLIPGSICLILIKPGPKTPRREWLFVGEFTAKNIRLVKGKDFSAYISRVVKTDEIPFPKPNETCWIIEFERIIKYEKPVKLGSCTSIKTSTSKKPLSEWVITGFTFIRLADAPKVVEAIRNMAKVTSPKVPTHDELVTELLDLGVWLNFLVRKEEPTPDGLYKIDVTWTDAEGHRPLKAFEVEISGNVDVALARLTHAYDKWGCEQLWLIVSDEAKAERARKLVEPRLKGSFAKIKNRIRILGWEDIHEMYTSYNPYKELLKDLSKRG